MGYVTLMARAELGAGTARRVELSAELAVVVVVTPEGEVYALEDNCSHRDYPLSEGPVDGRTITCPWHGACFDAATGEPLCGPAYYRVRTFGVRVREGMVEVEVGKPEGRG